MGGGGNRQGEPSSCACNQHDPPPTHTHLGGAHPLGWGVLPLTVGSPTAMGKGESPMIRAAS
jgi:hypothetical protein